MHPGPSCVGGAFSFCEAEVTLKLEIGGKTVVDGTEKPMSSVIGIPAFTAGKPCSQSSSVDSGRNATSGISLRAAI
jgi:hypothetical protein